MNVASFATMYYATIILLVVSAVSYGYVTYVALAEHLVSTPLRVIIIMHSVWGAAVAITLAAIYTYYTVEMNTYWLQQILSLWHVVLAMHFLAWFMVINSQILRIVIHWQPVIGEIK